MASELKLHTIQSPLKIHYVSSNTKKSIYFGQLMVETRYNKIDFAKEVANAVIIQAELNGKSLDYTPSGVGFVTHIEKDAHVLVFEGDLSGYLQLPPEDICSLHVSFREASEQDKLLKGKLGLSPTYVLTLSIVASSAGEFGDEGYWNQLASNLWTGLTTPAAERSGDPNAKIAIVYGNEDSYKIVLGNWEER